MDIDTSNSTQTSNVTLTWVGSNDSLNQVTKYFNVSVISLSNSSDATQIQTITTVKLFDLYEMYKTKEQEQLMMYKLVAYVLGTLIILSNLVVVISSGLILKKGQQPKSTYLLLGNVSLADTIVGISIIFGALVDHNHSLSSNPLCIFQIGMLVCPAMVSIFSVGLIAVDRYIYILHGLYYQRWFNTTKVRIGILCIWMIGITLAFLPATGWVNKELHGSKCYYVGLFPGSLILLNSLLSIIPIVVVAVLYSIILVKALANVHNIKAAKKSRNEVQAPKLRIFRGNGKVENIESSRSFKSPIKIYNHKLKRSTSFNNHYESKAKNETKISSKSKSINDLTEEDKENNINHIQKRSTSNSEYSIYTIESSSDPNYSHSEIAAQSKLNISHVIGKKRKPKEPNKWRAITVVMLTSGSFIVTWLPFFIIVIFFVFCEEKLTNPKCFHLRTLLGGPIATLAFLNSILNPLIYAWWHKGFQRSVKMFLRKYWQKCCCQNIF